jgi:hypothetical protein
LVCKRFPRKDVDGAWHFVPLALPSGLRVDMAQG